MTQQRTKKKAAKKKSPRTGAQVHFQATTREGSKSAMVLDLLKRKEGATLQDLMKATGWQAHSIRGFLAGAAVKKTGAKVASAKGEDEVRRYSLE